MGETGAQAKADHEARKANKRQAQIAAASANVRHAPEPTFVPQRTYSTPIAQPRAPYVPLDLDDEPVGNFGVRNPTPWLIGLGVVLIAALIFILTWKREADFDVSGHRWERTVTVQQYSVVKKSDWCDEKSHGAYDIRRSTEQRSTRQVPDGKDCVTIAAECHEHSCKKVDDGNGAGGIECQETCTPAHEECKPKYRDEPVYDDWCVYKVNEWVRGHTYAEHGGSPNKNPPTWPNPTIQTCHELALGCQRLGPRTEEYEVYFVENGTTEEHTCEFAESKWAQFHSGDTVHAQVGVVTDVLDCDSVKR
ncbi:MAG: hypothetical protein E6R03_08440 [Hyphomicrobiaceae bacterium]|nr:MAG: hypothetical protein E6R03_08440 [Hyphomicrobiaceae bacterium]